MSGGSGREVWGARSGVQRDARRSAFFQFRGRGGVVQDGGEKGPAPPVPSGGAGRHGHVRPCGRVPPYGPSLSSLAGFLPGPVRERRTSASSSTACEAAFGMTL